MATLRINWYICLVQKNRIQIQGYHEIDYFIKGDIKKAKRVYLLLHGYAENAKVLYNNLEEILPTDDDCLILAPNGPFPLPAHFPLTKPKEDNKELIRMFAWYFFDAKTSTYYIDYKLPCEILFNLLEDLGLSNIPTTLIGFSQGGYLSLFAGERVPQVDHIIGINCGLRYDMLKGPVKKRIDIMNGDCDVIVEPAKTIAGHKELIKMGSTGEHFLIPNEGHKLTSAFRDKIKELI